MAILNVITMSTPPQYFTKAHKEALAISSAGCGLGATVIPIFISWLLNTFGWRGCFLLYAGFNLQVCIIAMAFDTKKPQDINNSKETLKEQLQKLISNQLYLLFLVTVTLVGMTVSVTNILLMDFALEKGKECFPCIFGIEPILRYFVSSVYILSIDSISIISIKMTRLGDHWLPVKYSYSRIIKNKLASDHCPIVRESS